MENELIDNVLYDKSVDLNKRFEKFSELSVQFSDEQYWLNLRKVYQLYQTGDFDFTYFFLSTRKKRNLLMCVDEQMVLKSLPLNIWIYRVCKTDNLNTKGLSWTLSSEKAESILVLSNEQITSVENMFVIDKQRIESNSIIAFFNDQNQQEIIYIPSI